VAPAQQMSHDTSRSSRQGTGSVLRTNRQTPCKLIVRPCTILPGSATLFPHLPEQSSLVQDSSTPRAEGHETNSELAAMGRS